MADQETFQRGVEMRKQVLGEAYVERALDRATPLTRDFQALTTEYCWGAVWGRGGLEPKQRSMLNIAMLTALNKPDELRLHLNGALRNGVTEEEIVEVLLQTAIYCGIPAANSAFRITQEVMSAADA